MIDSGFAREQPMHYLMAVGISNNAYHQCVEILMQAEADVNMKDKNGHNVLYRALMTDSIECLQCILKAPVEINQKDKLGQNALQNNVANDKYVDEEVVMLPVAAGEKIDGTIMKREKFGKTTEVDVPEYLKEKETDIRLYSVCRDVIRKHLIETPPHINLFCKIQ